MTRVVVATIPGGFENAMKVFRARVQNDGIVRELKRRSHYVGPAEARKAKSFRARRRRNRAARW